MTTHIIGLATMVMVALLTGVGCRGSLKGVDCRTQAPEVGVVRSCLLPGHPDRDFLVQRPAASGDGKLPVIIALHGGGGAKEGMNALTCPGGDPSDRGCLGALAAERGYVLVIPDGYPNPLGFRSWNQGGQAPHLQCPYACEKNSDDVGVLDALVDHLGTFLPIDPRRVSVVGFSNGAGMAHRLACERADRYAAIAAISGANQFAAAAACQPSRAIPVMQIHGTADPCWPHGGGEGRCLAVQKGTYTSVVATMVGDERTPGWARRFGCQLEPAKETRAIGDGLALQFQRFSGCRAPVVQVDVIGGGHTWPGGDQYLKASRIGLLAAGYSATVAVFDFLATVGAR